MANRLINEQSPYLLQHAHNPVDWYPWGDEAFEHAKREHRPVIVSIGYAACHWCHVMEHESFEDAATAAYMNEHFVCIKVDREEHPDVDHMYMDAVQTIGGNGGWPLNVFVTPERAPFYGGTYYPPRPAYNRPSWMQLMQRMMEIWEQQPEDVAAHAEQMIGYLTNASQRTFTAKNELSAEISNKIAEGLLKMADKEKGGFGNAPKFPGTMAISYLLEHYHYANNDTALQHALHSLDAMTEGGIYDQLGGGFARYATDRNWLIPHFEKMLYDNALLIISLCDAYSITKEEKYKVTIEETIAFLERELKDESGGYYCALDADSEGVEGKFYTWTWKDWKAVVGDDAIAQTYFGVTEHGNWEETNILHIAKGIDKLAEEFGLSEEEVIKHVERVKQQLFAARTKRIRPLTDDKSLLSWNALMNIALSKAGVVLENETYTVRASEHMVWMLSAFVKDSDLQHVWKKGKARISAKLDDYAYLIQALLQLASASGTNDWVLMAARYMETVIEEFSQENIYFYFTSGRHSDIPVRKVDLYDGATPSANAVMAHNLWILGMCMERSAWRTRAIVMIEQMSDTAVRYAYSFGYWALLIQRHVKGFRTVVGTGENVNDTMLGIQRHFLPEAFLLTSSKKISDPPIFNNKFLEEQVRIFVCTEDSCLSPVSSASAALGLLTK